MRANFTSILLIILITCLSVSAQSIKKETSNTRAHSLQTNIFSLIRFQNALNLQYRYQNLESRRGWIASIDVPFYLSKEPENQLHRYKSNIVFPTFDLKMMFTKNFGFRSEAYVGFGFDYGFNQYKHRHVVCLSSMQINGTCICNQTASNTFFSSRHRAGMTLRFAVPLRFSPDFIPFLALQSSFSYIFKPQLTDRLYNVQCGETTNVRPEKSTIEIVTYNAHNPDFTGAQMLFHLEFILPVKMILR